MAKSHLSCRLAFIHVWIFQGVCFPVKHLTNVYITVRMEWANGSDKPC